MNKKAIGIILGVAGVGLIGTYFYMRSKKPAITTGNTGIGDTGQGVPAKPKTIVSAGVSAITNVAKTISNILKPPIVTPAKPAFAAGDFIYAKIDTNIYSNPTFSTTDLVGSVKKDDKIGTYAQTATSLMSMIFMGGDTRYVKTADIFKK